MGNVSRSFHLVFMVFGAYSRSGKCCKWKRSADTCVADLTSPCMFKFHSPPLPRLVRPIFIAIRMLSSHFFPAAWIPRLRTYASAIRFQFAMKPCKVEFRDKELLRLHLIAQISVRRLKCVWYVVDNVFKVLHRQITLNFLDVWNFALSFWNVSRAFEAFLKFFKFILSVWSLNQVS